jgi:hypothetical protein
MSTLTVEVGRCHARVVPGRGGTAHRERLLRLQREALDEPLALALEAVGLREDHLVCVRRLEVRLRVDPCAADGEVVRGLAALVAEALLAGRATGGMVVYATRAHAVADLVRSVAAGEEARAWAWSQLGLWSEPDGCTGGEAALAAMLAEPRRIVPLLASLAADPPALRALAARLPSGAWRALARAALRAAGADPDAPDRAAPASVPAPPGSGRAHAPGARGGGARHEPAEPEEIPVALRARLAAALRASRILAALPSSAGADGAAAAALALLETDPGLLCLGTAPAGPLLAAAAAGVTPVPAAPAVAVAATRPGPGREAPRDGGVASASASPAGPPAAEPTPPRAEGGGRDAAHTVNAGLLFLLPPLGELLAAGAPGRVLAERPLRWTLYRLGGLLAPEASRDDAARLAFCGLRPRSAPPDAEAPPPGPEERLRLESLAAELRLTVAERLGRPRREAEAALAALVRRRGRVVADPGWFEVSLSLDDVSLEVRRAGLDCDPGWLPWLGVVVRFRYE